MQNVGDGNKWWWMNARRELQEPKNDCTSDQRVVAMARGWLYWLLKEYWQKMTLWQSMWLSWQISHTLTAKRMSDGPSCEALEPQVGK